MKLRFIGADGSMGLKHGEVYETRPNGRFCDRYFWLDVAHIHNDGHSEIIAVGPYSSPQSFAKNWEAV